MKYLTPERAAEVAAMVRRVFIDVDVSDAEADDIETLLTMAADATRLDALVLRGLQILSTAVATGKDGQLWASWCDGCGLDDDEQEPVKTAIAWIAGLHRPEGNS